jgi:hypothetical protein
MLFKKLPNSFFARSDGTTAQKFPNLGTIYFQKKNTAMVSVQSIKYLP